MWAEGTIDGTYIRRSLRTKSWEKAVTKARDIETAEDPVPPPPKEEPITVEQAVEEYLADARARELRESTLYKLEIIFRKEVSRLVQAREVHAPS